MFLNGELRPEVSATPAERGSSAGNTTFLLATGDCIAEKKLDSLGIKRFFFSPSFSAPLSCSGEYEPTAMIPEDLL